MHTKLTLRLDERLIESAKRYAREHEKSVSQVVADYFAALERAKADSTVTHAGPITQSLIGILSQDAESEEGYYAHLERKYL